MYSKALVISDFDYSNDFTFHCIGEEDNYLKGIFHTQGWQFPIPDQISNLLLLQVPQSILDKQNPSGYIPTPSLGFFMAMKIVSFFETNSTWCNNLVRQVEMNFL